VRLPAAFGRLCSADRAAQADVIGAHRGLTRE